MLDLSLEQPITLAEAAKIIPPSRGGRRCHISTLVRWIMNGTRSQAGAVVRLEALRCGSKWVTSRAAIQRFCERLTPHFPDEDTELPRSPAEKKRASNRARKELAEMGV